MEGEGKWRERERGITYSFYSPPRRFLVATLTSASSFQLEGEHGFIFNLITDEVMQVNALFIPDAVRSEVTWLGALHGDCCEGDDERHYQAPIRG